MLGRGLYPEGTKIAWERLSLWISSLGPRVWDDSDTAWMVNILFTLLSFL